MVAPQSAERGRFSLHRALRQPFQSGNDGHFLAQDYGRSYRRECSAHISPFVDTLLESTDFLFGLKFCAPTAA